MVEWLSRLRHRAVQGWTAPPGSEQEGPLLDSAFLKRIEALSLQVGRRGTTGFAGEHASRHQAHAVEFANYRDYRPGDDFRLIDWNVYARLGQLTLRLSEVSEATTLHLLLDCSSSMAWGAPSKFRTMQRLAAALGCIALTHYDGVAIVPLQGTRAPSRPRMRGKNDLSQLLAVIDGLRPAGAVDMAEAVASYCRVPRRGLGIVISDLLAAGGRADVAPILRRAGLEPTVLQVLAREEAEPRLEGPLDLVDCETGSVLTTSIDGEALRAYAARFDAWTADLEASCAAQRATFVRLFSDQPLDDLLLGALRGRVLQ